MRLVRAAILFLAFIGLGAPAASATDFYVLGSMGDAGAADQCSAGEYVVGFSVHSGAWFDQIAVVCGQIDSNLSWSTTTTFAARGGPGGAPESQAATSCSTQEIVTGFLAYFTDDRRQVQGVTLNCSSAATGAVRTVSFWSPDQDTAKYQASENCPSGQVATGFNIRYGKAVNGLGLICGPFVAPSSVTVVTTSSAPSKPIKTTGQPIGGGATSTVADNVLICQGGGMTVTPLSGSSGAMLVSFGAASQGANAAQPAPGQCAWSGGPIGGGWNKLGVSSTQPMGQQLLQAAKDGGVFTVEAHTLGNGIIYVSRIDNVQLASDSGTAAAANATTPPAGSGYVLACQGGSGMRISGGGATIGGPSYFIVSFQAASEAGNSGQLDPGSCAWIDRPLNAAEPLVLDIPNDLQNADALKQALKHGSFQVHANNTGKALLVNQIDSVQGNGGGSGGGVSVSIGVNLGSNGGGASSDGGSALQPPIAEDDGDSQPMTVARAVNVHTKSDGKGDVLGSLGVGTQVTGTCSKGWCHVTFSGGDGYVAQSFLSSQ